jgi:hypothetical protein
MAVGVDLGGTYALIRHDIFDDTDDRKQNTAADTARGHLSNDRADIKASRRSTTCAQHPKNLTAYSTPDNPGKRIAKRSKVQIFQDAASNIATNSACNQTNN